MATVPHEDPRVTIGVDTHEDVHVAVALDQLGRRLGQLPVSTDPAGLSRLIDWASEFGVIDRIGVEALAARERGWRAGCAPRVWWWSRSSGRIARPPKAGTKNAAPQPPG